MSTEYELIVIGGGSMGLSTAYHAALRGTKTLVIEQYGYFNNLGSSAGASRQFRLQYAQQYMSELAIASQTYWANLQRQTKTTLIGQDGSLWFGDPAVSSQEGGIEAAETVMDTLDIPYSKVDAKEIQDGFHFKDLPPDYCGFFQANGGIINLKATDQALYNAAMRTGLVDFHEYEHVTGITSVEGNDITVSTNRGEYGAAKLAITAGPFTNQVTDCLGLNVAVIIWDMSSAYFRKADPNIQYPTWFVFQEPQDSTLFYGFPEVDWSNPGYIRVAPDFPDKIIVNPSERSPTPSPKSLGLTSQWVAKHMSGLEPAPQLTSTCLITLAGNSSKELLLDYAPDWVPNNKNIVTYTAGWAAKYIPILGDMVCQMLEKDVENFVYGKYTIPQSNFAINWIKN